MTNDNIEESMSAEIRAKHIECQKQIEAAAEAVKAACKSAEYLGQLVHKASRAKKHTVYQWLAESAGVPGDAGRAYMLAHTTAQKRKVHSDRRALQKLNLIEAQTKTTSEPTKKRQPMSLATKIQRANKMVTEHLQRRKIEDMTPAEKSLFKAHLTPLAEVYVKVCQK